MVGEDAQIGAVHKAMTGVKDKMYEKIGQRYTSSYNLMAENFTRTSENTPAFNATVSAMVGLHNNKNTGDAAKLAQIVKNNPSAVETYKIYSAGVEGNPKMTVSIKESALSEDDKDAFKSISNPGNIFIVTDSEAVPLRHRVKDPEYTAMLQMPKAEKIRFGTEEVEIRTENRGTIAEPRFKITGEYFEPVRDEKNNFAYNANGELLTKRISPIEIEKRLNILTKGKLDVDLSLNPNYLHTYVVKQAYQMRELIDFINKNKLVTHDQIPKEYWDELELIGK